MISREWKEANSASERLRTLARDGVAYHRPFVVIDSEGCDRAGNDIIQKGVVYPDHGTFLWGAQAWVREEPGTGNNDHPGNRGRNGPALWLGDESKRFLTPTEIFDWLLELPAVSGNANFVIFSGGYDFGQVLHSRGMPRHTVWEICKNLKFKEADADSDPEEVRDCTWWHPYGSPRHYGHQISKGKILFDMSARSQQPRERRKIQLSYQDHDLRCIRIFPKFLAQGGQEPGQEWLCGTTGI
jgi:hypothetical protein